MQYDFVSNQISQLQYVHNHEKPLILFELAVDDKLVQKVRKANTLIDCMSFTGDLMAFTLPVLSLILSWY